MASISQRARDALKHLISGFPGGEERPPREAVPIAKSHDRAAEFGQRHRAARLLALRHRNERDQARMVFDQGVPFRPIKRRGNHRRGGLIGKLIKNTYFWRGEDETRSFIEWRLLHKLKRMGLNVPTPAAACYRKTAMFYTADLLTVRIPGIRSLADRLIEAPGDEQFWQSLGAGIAATHEAGVYHADLNAYNVQLKVDDELWLLDFDRGALSPGGTWKQETLGRLHRSLRKIRELSAEVNFAEENWEQFLAGYFAATRTGD